MTPEYKTHLLSIYDKLPNPKKPKKVRVRYFNSGMDENKWQILVNGHGVVKPIHNDKILSNGIPK